MAIRLHTSTGHAIGGIADSCLADYQNADGVVRIPNQISATAPDLPDAATQLAIWARELKPSLFRMVRTWLSTVRSEMKRRAPIGLLLSPSATSLATSASRLPRFANPPSWICVSLV